MKVVSSTASIYSRETTPKFELKYWDTAFTYPSQGLTREVYYFNEGNTPTATSNYLVHSGIETNLFSYFANGTPKGVTRLSNYAIRWHGYIYPDKLLEHNTNAATRHFVIGAIGMGGEIAVNIGGTIYFSGTMLDEHTYTTASIEFSNNTPVETAIWYWKQSEGEGGYAFFWMPTGGPAVNVNKWHIHPFGAGYCHTSAVALESSIVPDIISVSVSRQRETPTVLEFSIPLVTISTAFALPYNGYKYNSYLDAMQHFSSDGNGTHDLTIRKNRLVKLRVGYCCPNPDFELSGLAGIDLEDAPVEELYTEFTGHIVNWAINHEQGLVTVTCLDFLNLLNYRINENWPDKASYWIAHYNKDGEFDEPDGVDKPIAYDGWRFERVIRDLLLKCNIDDTLFEGKKLIRKYDNSISQVYDLFEGKDIILRRPINYGNADLSEADANRFGTNTDDEYLYPSEISETVFNRAYNIADQMGYIIGFDPNGQAIIKARNNPYDILWSPSNIQFGSGWTTAFNIGAIGGYYWSNLRNPTSVITDYNLLLNPSFESGTIGLVPTNWITGGTYSNNRFSKQLGGFDGQFCGKIDTSQGLQTNFQQNVNDQTIVLNDLIQASIWYDIIPDIPVPDNFSRIVRVIDEVHSVSATIVWRQYGEGGDSIIRQETVYSIDANVVPIDRNAAITVEWPTNTGPNQLARPQLSIDHNIGYIELPQGYVTGGQTVYLTYSYAMDAKIVFTLHQHSEKQSFTSATTTAIYHHSLESFPTENGWKKLMIYDIIQNVAATGLKFDIVFSHEVPIGFQIGCAFDKSELYDLTALYDPSRDSVLTSASCFFTTSGAGRIDLVVGLMPEGGRLNVEVSDSSGQILRSGFIETGYPEELLFYDDIEFTAAINPCQVKIMGEESSTGFGDYQVRFIPSGVCRFNAAFIYDVDNDFPLYGLASDELLTQLNTTRRVENLRNDAIVIGAEQLLRVPNSDETAEVINPKNPLIPYRISRTTDIDSLYNINAVNYVGMPITTIVIDTNLTDQRHVDWLSFSIVDRFRIPQPETSVGLIGFPVVELLDPVAIIDRRYGLLEIGKPSFVQSYRHTLSYQNFETEIDLSGYKEFASFEPREALPAWLCPDNVANFQIKYSGKKKNSIGYYEPSGTVINPDYELAINNGTTLNAFPFYDPYFSEMDDERFVEIKMDIARAGYYDIAIMAGPGLDDIPAGTVVAYLTQMEADQTDDSAHWEWYEQSTDNKFYWDGVDMRSTWNSEFGTNLDDPIVDEIQAVGWYVLNNALANAQTVTVNNGIATEIIKFGKFWVRIRSRDTDAPVGDEDTGDTITFRSYEMDTIYNDVSAAYIYTNLGYVTQCQVFSMTTYGNALPTGISLHLDGEQVSYDAVITPRYIDSNSTPGTGMVLKIVPDDQFTNRKYTMTVNARCMMFSSVHFQSADSSSPISDALPVDLITKEANEIPIEGFPKQWFPDLRSGTTTATFFPDDYNYEYSPGTRTITWRWEETGIVHPVDRLGQEQYANEISYNSYHFVEAWLSYVFYFNVYVRDKSGRAKYCYDNTRIVNGVGWADNSSSSGGFFENIVCFARNYVDPIQKDYLLGETRWNFLSGETKKTSGVVIPVDQLRNIWYKLENQMYPSDNDFWTCKWIEHHMDSGYERYGIWGYNWNRGSYNDETFVPPNAEPTDARAADPDGAEHLFIFNGNLRSNVSQYPQRDSNYNNSIRQRGNWMIYQTRGYQASPATDAILFTHDNYIYEEENNQDWTRGVLAGNKLDTWIRGIYNYDSGYSCIYGVYPIRGFGWPNENSADWTVLGAPIVLHLSRYPSYGG